MNVQNRLSPSPKLRLRSLGKRMEVDGSIIFLPTRYPSGIEMNEIIMLDKKDIKIKMTQEKNTKGVYHV